MKDYKAEIEKLENENEKLLARIENPIARHAYYELLEWLVKIREISYTQARPAEMEYMRLINYVQKIEKTNAKLENKLIEARQEIDRLKEGVKDALGTFKSIGCTTEAEIVQALLKLIKE